MNGMLKEKPTELVMKCLEKKDHMNVLQLDSFKEIDEFILQALLKGV